MPAVNELRFVAVGQDDPLAEPLLAELAVEYATRYGGATARVSTWLRTYPAEHFAPPDGGLLIGLLDGQPVTGGAFQRFDEHHRRAQAHLDRQQASSTGTRQGRCWPNSRPRSPRADTAASI